MSFTIADSGLAAAERYSFEGPDFGPWDVGEHVVDGPHLGLMTDTMGSGDGDVPDSVGGEDGDVPDSIGGEDDKDDKSDD
jgi:hypothetical protein